MTYAELKEQIDKLSTEQLAMKVVWCGEMRGGEVRHFEVLDEDQINPSGDGMESVSLYAKERAAEQDISIEEAEKLTRDEEDIVAHKHQPLLVVD